MIPSERHKKILKMVSERGVVSITELIEILDVSHMTIRRDIQKLEQQGAVTSVSGGIQSLEKLPFEPSHNTKANMFNQEKLSIGQLAAELIPENSSIYLDAGTTTLAIAQQIAHRDDLLIITNDFVIMSFLIENGKGKLMHTGGSVCKENHSSVGEFTARMLLNLFVDIAFISASSWSLKGLTTPDQEKVPVKRAIVESSARRILVSDSSKYGKAGTFFAIPLTVFDTIVTDNKLPENVIKTIRDSNITLLASDL